MAQKEPRTSASASIPNINPAQYAETGQKQLEAMAEMQKELIAVIEEVNREWATRAQAEAKLATEFAGKLSAAKSIPETTAICQEWMTRRMELFAEDTRRFAAGIQKFTAAATRSLPMGWKGGSS